jgi:hypothetical protein
MAGRQPAVNQLKWTYPRARKIKGRACVFVMHVVVVSICHQCTGLDSDEEHTKYEYWKR